MIENKEPYLRIATKYGLNDKTVKSHADLHVLPAIKAREDAAQAAAMARVMSYRDEVNLPLPEKSKYVEDKLWTEYFGAEKVGDRMTIIREINKQQAEQAKLSGAYINAADNPQTTERVLKLFSIWLSDNKDASPEVIEKTIALHIAGWAEMGLDIPRFQKEVQTVIDGVIG